MSGICPKMNGKKCAENYCEFWDHDELACTLALESRKRVELLNLLLDKAEELADDVKDKEHLKELIKELNVVNTISTVQ